MNVQETISLETLAKDPERSTEFRLRVAVALGARGEPGVAADLVQALRFEADDRLQVIGAWETPPSSLLIRSYLDQARPLLERMVLEQADESPVAQLGAFVLGVAGATGIRKKLFRRLRDASGSRASRLRLVLDAFRRGHLGDYIGLSSAAPTCRAEICELARSHMFHSTPDLLRTLMHRKLVPRSFDFLFFSDLIAWCGSAFPRDEQAVWGILAMETDDLLDDAREEGKRAALFEYDALETREVLVDQPPLALHRVDAVLLPASVAVEELGPVARLVPGARLLCALDRERIGSQQRLTSIYHAEIAQAMARGSAPILAQRIKYAGWRRERFGALEDRVKPIDRLPDRSTVPRRDSPTGGRRSIRRLSAGLEDLSHIDAHSRLERLGKTRSPRALDVLRNIALGRRPGTGHLKSSAVGALGHFSSDEAVAVCRELALGTVPTSLREAAVSALCRMTSHQSLDALRALHRALPPVDDQQVPGGGYRSGLSPSRRLAATASSRDDLVATLLDHLVEDPWQEADVLAALAGPGEVCRQVLRRADRLEFGGQDIPRLPELRGAWSHEERLLLVAAWLVAVARDMGQDLSTGKLLEYLGQQSLENCGWTDAGWYWALGQRLRRLLEEEIPRLGILADLSRRVARLLEPARILECPEAPRHEELVPTFLDRETTGPWLRIMHRRWRRMVKGFETRGLWTSAGALASTLLRCEDDSSSLLRHALVSVEGGCSIAGEALVLGLQQDDTWARNAYNSILSWFADPLVATPCPLDVEVMPAREEVATLFFAAMDAVDDETLEESLRASLATLLAACPWDAVPANRVCDTVARLERCLRSSSLLRDRALAVLERISFHRGSEGLVAPVERLARDRDPGRRRSAASWLGRIGGQQTFATLQELTGDRDQTTRLDALWSLAFSGGRGAAERIRAALGRRGAGDRELRAALGAASVLGDASLADAISPLAAPGSPVAVHALATLSLLGHQQALVSALLGEQPEAALRVLENPVHRRDVLPALPAHARHVVARLVRTAARPTHKATALRLLGELGSRGDVGGMERLLFHDNDAVRVAALEAVSRLWPGQLVEFLVDANNFLGNEARLARVRAMARVLPHLDPADRRRLLAVAAEVALDASTLTLVRVEAARCIAGAGEQSWG